MCVCVGGGGGVFACVCVVVCMYVCLCVRARACCVFIQPVTSHVFHNKKDFKRTLLHAR